MPSKSTKITSDDLFRVMRYRAELCVWRQIVAPPPALYAFEGECRNWSMAVSVGPEHTEAVGVMDDIHILKLTGDSAREIARIAARQAG